LVGVGVGVFRLVAAPFLAAADLAAALRPLPAGRRVLLPLDAFAPPRPDPPAVPRPPVEPPPRPLRPLRPLPPRPLVPAPLAPVPLVPVPPLRPPDRLAEVPVFDPALRPEPPPTAPPCPPLDRPVAPDEEREPEAVPRLAPLLPLPPGGTLGRITSGDSSL
jgi:hypothetical protein